MPKGEYDTPGPFTYRHGFVRRALGGHDHLCFRPAVHLDQAEREELVGLLNKGTHFEDMLEALEDVARIRNGWPEVFDKVDAAIAKATGGAE